MLLDEINGEDDARSVFEKMNSVTDRNFALLFGTLSHVLDYDDVNFTFHGHPSVALIPPILTYAKYNRELTGKELILSYIVGFEVQTRIGEDIGDKQYNNGLHVTSTLGIFGAAASLTKLMNFSYEQFCNLVGMCVSFSSGVRKNFGTMTKPLHVGILSENVYFFAKLVSRGFTANEETFNEPMSYSAITAGEHLELSSLEKLGKTWESAEFGIIVKLYPCCAYTHRSIDAVFELVDKYEIDVTEVEKIEAKVNPKVQKVLIYPEAKTGPEGKFSMQYCLSAALIDGKVNLNSFEKDEINRPEVRQLMKKVEMITDEKQIGVNKELEAEVTITTKDSKYKTVVEYPLGHPYNPLPDELMAEKVTGCVSEVIDDEKEAQLITICNELENYSSKDIMKVFTF